MRFPEIARAAVIGLALAAGQGCTSPTDATPARCGDLDLDDCRLAYAAAVEAVLPIETREDIVDWRVAPTQAATCRQGELTPVLDVLISFRTSFEPFVVTIGRDANGRARPCTH